MVLVHLKVDWRGMNEAEGADWHLQLASLQEPLFPIDHCVGNKIKIISGCLIMNKSCILRAKLTWPRDHLQSRPNQHLEQVGGS